MTNEKEKTNHSEHHLMGYSINPCSDAGLSFLLCIYFKL